MTALAATPHPNDAANAIAAKPSSADLSRIWSAPLPSPSLSEPRMVSGPLQKTSEEMTKPSTNRARSADPVSPDSRRCSQPPKPSIRDSSRSSEPAIPPTSSEPSTISIGALSPTSSLRSVDRTAIAEVPAISSVTSPSASVTTSLVRVGQPVAQGDAEGRAGQHGGDVDQGGEAGNHELLQTGRDGRDW